MVRVNSDSWTRKISMAVDYVSLMVKIYNMKNYVIKPYINFYKELTISTTTRDGTLHLFSIICHEFFFKSESTYTIPTFRSTNEMLGGVHSVVYR